MYSSRLVRVMAKTYYYFSSKIPSQLKKLKFFFEREKHYFFRIRSILVGGDLWGNKGGVDLI